MGLEPREALWNHLLADDGVIAAVGNRTYQRRVDTTEPLPVLVIQPPNSDIPKRDLDGVAFWQARIRVTAIGETQEQVECAANAVIAAVDGYTGMLAEELPVIYAGVIAVGQVDQAETNEVRQHIDLQIMYKR